MSSPQLTKSILKAKSPLSLGELEVRLGQATAELTARLAALDSEGGAVREKVQLLEDAQTLQVVCKLVLPKSTIYPRTCGRVHRINL